MNFIILKKKKLNKVFIIFYNSDNSFKFFFDYNKNYFQINRCTNTVIFKHNMFNNLIIYNINLFLQNMLSYNLTFFVKIKFKGKGYKIKIYKKNKIIFFFFGKSHLTLMKINNVTLIRLNKYKFILSFYNIKNLYKVAKDIVKIRKINVFTLRGLRKSKQIIYKRRGKKSSYS